MLRKKLLQAGLDLKINHISTLRTDSNRTDIATSSALCYADHTVIINYTKNFIIINRMARQYLLLRHF